MAKIKNNLITKDLQGRLGKQLVFKKYGDTTIVSLYPNMSRVKPSPLQLLYKQKFAAAMAYAKRQMQNPAVKAAYQAKVKGMQRAINVAIADFYYTPVIHSVHIHDFKGLSGDSVHIEVKDDFKVVSVAIAFIGSNGKTLHSSPTTEKEEWHWEYVLSENLAEKAIQLLVTAEDMPGNVTEAVFNL